MRLAIAGQVKVVRIAKCWNAELARLEYNVVDQTSAQFAAIAIMEVLVAHCSGEQRPGQALRGNLARLIQEALDAQGGKNVEMLEEDK